MKSSKRYVLIIMVFALLISGCSGGKSEKHLSSVEKAAKAAAAENANSVESAPAQEAAVQEEVSPDEILEASAESEKEIALAPEKKSEPEQAPGVVEKPAPVKAPETKAPVAKAEEKAVEQPPAEKPAEKKINEKPADYDKKSAREKIADSFARNKSVLLYFYSNSVKDSKADLHKIQEIAAANNAETVEIEALDEDAFRYSYSVEYVPTVFAIRPDSGMVARWMVDLPAKEIEAAISSKSKPVPEQMLIGKAISSKKPQLLFFMAQWCGYCRKLAPEVEKFEKDYSDRVEVVTIDIDRIPYRMKDSYVIDGVPALFITDKNGILVKRTGFPEGYKNYVKYFESLGVDMKKKS